MNENYQKCKAFINDHLIELCKEVRDWNFSVGTLDIDNGKLLELARMCTLFQKSIQKYE